MYLKAILLVVSMQLVAGCTSQIPAPAASLQHPANADAPTAALAAIGLEFADPSDATSRQTDPFKGSAPTSKPTMDDSKTHESASHEHGNSNATTQSASYVCPMHPDVTSETPARCPKCQMKLVKVEGK